MATKRAKSRRSTACGGAANMVAKKKLLARKTVTKSASKNTTKKIGASKKPSAARSNPVGKVLQCLKADYPDVKCALKHRSAFHLLIATILSAQSTDKRVNIVTKELFRKYRTPAAFAAAPLSSIEKAVQSTGFFRNKAKNIKACCIGLVENHGGKVPRELDSLVALAGVGRKTANVVLGTAYGLTTGVVVDTHVGRLSRRLGLTQQSDAVKVERDLMQLLPKKEWIDFSHRMIHHGRAVCHARKPKCEACSMNQFCPCVGVDK